MNGLKTFVVVAVVLVGGVGVRGDMIYTIDNFEIGVANQFVVSDTFTTYNFTLDGLPNEDVYFVGFSNFPDGNLYLNITGRTWSNGERLNIYIYGEPGDIIPAWSIYSIVDGGDGELFSVTSSGAVTLGSGDDDVFDSSSISINGGPAGNVEEVYFSDKAQIIFDSVAVVTPEPATITLIVLGGLAVLRRRR